MYLMTSSKKHAVLARSACGTSLRSSSSLQDIHVGRKQGQIGQVQAEAGKSANSKALLAKAKQASHRHGAAAIGS
jgi:hypothetical protein